MSSRRSLNVRFININMKENREKKPEYLYLKLLVWICFDVLWNGIMSTTYGEYETDIKIFD